MEQQSEFVAIHHITITVRDMEVAKKFYAGALGLRIEAEAKTSSTAFGGFAIEDGKLVELGAEEGGGALYDNSHDERHKIIFEQIGGVRLTLVAFSGDDIKGAPALMLDRLGYTHLAFDVRDVDAFMDRMRSSGVEPVAPGFIQDPDGNLIQIQEAGSAEQILELYKTKYATHS
jgi:catechol 2,3-dioxygenase-like lactoylglutathione lyase family enzyme